MDEKLFRQDLYYRLSVVSICLPALRERREDIPDLVDYFLRKYGRELGVKEPSILPEAVQQLRSYEWPGNIRELENVVRKALLQSHGYSIDTNQIRAALAQPRHPGDGSESPFRHYISELLGAAERGETTDVYDQLLKGAEKELFSQAIQFAKGNQAKAARWLGISRLTMREKLIQFGLHPNQEEKHTE
jgi:DNA-binding NtrC family response regulator